LEKAAARGRRRTAIITLHPQHATRARIGVEPQHASVRGQPFQAIARISRGADIGPLHIGQIARPFATYAVKDFIERAHLARLDALPRAKGLRRSGRRRHCCTQQQGDKQGRDVPHQQLLFWGE
jgi:hypothetical protein